MKRFLISTTTALAITATGAMAGSHTSDGAFMDYQPDPAVDLFASDLLGARIYATETELGDTVEDGAETEWDDLGEVNDMILNPDGSVKVVILGVGGFLGIGEQDVAIDFSQLKIVRDGSDATDYFLVVNATQEMIEAAPEFNRVEQAAEEAEAEMEEAAQETGEAAQDAANEAEQAVEGAANEVEQAAEGAANEVSEAADDAAQAAENAGNEVEAEVEAETNQ